MKRHFNYLLYLLAITMLLASPGELLADKKSSPGKKIYAIDDKAFDYELYARADEGQWYIDLGHPKHDPVKRYLGPFTLKEAQKLVILMGEIPIAWDGLPFEHPLEPNIVTWVYVVTFDTFAELAEVMQSAEELGIQTKYRIVPEAGWRRN